jgi:uncharacterized protein (DUF1015 family)
MILAVRPMSRPSRRSIPRMVEPERAGGHTKALRLAPFRALRFSPDVVPDLAAVTCPPYDVIGEHGVAAWEAADPYNVVRLILPRPGPDENRYAHAARDLRRWLNRGVLSQDDAPALYVYEQTTSTGTAFGLVGAVSLHDPAERVVLPHEDVFPGPVVDRTELMAATGAQLEPILLTYRGGGAASAAVDAALDTEPVIAVNTIDESSHRVWRLSEPATLAAIESDLGPRQALIADGHHRYAAYHTLRDRLQGQGQIDRPDLRAQTSQAARYGLAMLVDAERHPLRLGSIHRSIADIALENAMTAAADGFDAVTALANDVDLADALARAGRSGPAFVLSDGRNSALLEHPIGPVVDAALPQTRSQRWRGLDASIACEFVLPRVFGVQDADRRVAYHHAAAEAIMRAHRLGGVALLIRPASHADVLAVAANGERMPRKSTSFGPKPRTGLLMRLLADSLA